MTSAAILARNLARLRDAQGLTQDALAAKSKVGIATVKRIEMQRANPTLANLDLLAAALNVTPAELLTPAETLPEDVAELIDRWVAGERLRPRLDPPVGDEEIRWLRGLRRIWSSLPLTERSLEALVRAHRSRSQATDPPSA